MFVRFMLRWSVVVSVPVSVGLVTVMIVDGFGLA